MDRSGKKIDKLAALEWVLYFRVAGTADLPSKIYRLGC